MDVKELFETQIPSGPDQVAPADRIPAGRRALRRHRLYAAGTASLAVVAIVGALGVVTDVADLRSDRDNAPATNTPSPSDGATYTPAPPDEALTKAIPVDRDWPGTCTDDPDSERHEVPCWQDMVRQGSEGKVRRREGVQISQRIDDPVTDPSVEDGVALEATYKGVTQWIFLANGEGGGTLQGEPVLGQTFEEWAAELTPVTDAEHRYPELKDAEGVTRVGTAWYDAAGKLVIREDAEVVERIDDPMGYSEETASVALAAKVDGVEWWTLLSGPPGWHTDIQRAGDGDFRTWVDEEVREAYSGNNSSGFAFDDSGKIVSTDPWIKVVDQIVDPDIDWITTPGERSALVEYSAHGHRSFSLIRTRNRIFEGAIETVSVSYHPKKDTLQTVLARLQKEDRT